MATASVIHRWSREEYEHMAEAGVFGDRRVELVEGTVYDMTPQSRRHAAALILSRAAGDAGLSEDEQTLAHGSDMDRGKVRWFPNAPLNRVQVRGRPWRRNGFQVAPESEERFSSP